MKDRSVNVLSFPGAVGKRAWKKVKLLGGRGGSQVILKHIDLKSDLEGNKTVGREKQNRIH